MGAGSISNWMNNLKNVFPFINLIYGDITDFFTCINATKNQDIVFHLAALISVAYSTKNPKLCYKVNIQGTKNLLQSCKKNKVQTFIFSSSAAVYGNRSTPCIESDKPNPESPYAKSKLESEKLCYQYYKEYGINTASYLEKVLLIYSIR